MARGDHPKRTPVYGGLLMAVALLTGVLVVSAGEGWPGWLRAVVLVAALIAALAGWLMTFRDLTPRRRRR
jgi:UDP-N-acetylmuramyl pentapeptide phosphotransferase/UDP-N-acetylglucosamine-1-phosphate transferase